jgi:hypothetical protein
LFYVLTLVMLGLFDEGDKRALKAILSYGKV